MNGSSGEKRWARSACPRCSTSAPLKLMIGGRGNTFQCKGCDAKLLVSKLNPGKTLFAAASAMLAVKLLAIPFVVVMLLALAAAVAEWAMLKVYLSDE